MERRLAAVLIADVAGYGRLSRADEEGTRARFQVDLHEVFEPKIAAHHGRLVKTMGDGLLVEFRSVVDALRCAIEIQHIEAARNAEVAADRRLKFRIGINLGDVIVEGDDIEGDGVNIAHRLQGLADEGGIALSGSAHEQVKNKLEIGFEFLGEQRLKNIGEPVRAYRVMMEPAAGGRTIRGRKIVGRFRRWAAIAAAAVALLMAAGAIAWWRPWNPAIEPASIERMALPLPDKPSIAVLPFTNMSDDPKQEYFADGITDDLITELSKVSGLFVISRNSTFVYKGKTVPPKQVSEELGVRYVLEGSVQRAGDRLRINAQLIDALSGGHEWADRFDGSLADVFALQDTVTRNIAGALAVKLTAAEQIAVGQQETSVPAAYDAFLRGWEHYRRTTPEDYVKALSSFEQATKLDAEYGRAHAATAMVYARIYEKFWEDRVGLTQNEVRDRAMKNLEQAKKRPTTLSHQAAGIWRWIAGTPGPAIAEFKEAIALDSSDPLSYAYLGGALTAAGRSAEAMPHLRTAMRLDPHYPSDFLYFLGLAQFGLEQFDAAAASFEDVTRLNPDDEYPFGALAATYGHLGRKQDAAPAIARFNAIRIGHGDVPLSITSFYYRWIDFTNYRDRERFVDGLRLAGAPESLFSGELAEQNRLTGEEIRTLFFGHRLHGRTPWKSQQHAASITAEGIVTMSGDWAWTADATAQIESDRLCLKWGTYVGSCVRVFRNPGGTKAKENEYIWLDQGDWYTFSQVE